MNHEEFIKYVDTMSENGKFSFGLNWTDYVKTKLNDTIVENHTSNLSMYYKDYNLSSMSVLDIGCGSGLSSLSFNLLGCKNIHSIDVDKNSVSACELTKEKYSNYVKNNWTIENKSILDEEFVKSSQKYDIVYSWGVLHHTGNMWRAIKNATSLVKENGIIHLALYVSGERYTDDLKMKMFYNLSEDDVKKRMIFDWLNYYYISRGVDILSTNDRGMNKYNDCIDWLGGIPYEVCDPDILDSYLNQNSFTKMFYKGGKQGSNFICLYKNKTKLN